MKVKYDWKLILPFMFHFSCSWINNFNELNMLNCRIFILLLVIVFIAPDCLAGNKETITVSEYDEYILTHLLTPAGPVPTALDANGVYPYVSYSETSNRPVPKKYHFGLVNERWGNSLQYHLPQNKTWAESLYNE